MACDVLAGFSVAGQENLREVGPLQLVANRFSFTDPVAMVRATPWPLEFLEECHTPFAARATTYIPKLWGEYPVCRGTASRDALRASEATLAQGGAMAVLPEGGS